MRAARGGRGRRGRAARRPARPRGRAERRGRAARPGHSGRPWGGGGPGEGLSASGDRDLLRGRRAIGARRGVEGGWGPLSEGVGAAAAAVAAATEAGKRREGCGGAAVAAPLRRQSPGSRLEPASRPELQPGFSENRSRKFQVPTLQTWRYCFLLPRPQPWGTWGEAEVSVFSCPGRGEWGLHSLKNEDTTE